MSSSKKTNVGKKVSLSDEQLVMPEIHHEEDMNFEEGQLSVDVFDTEEEIVVVAPVAGVKKDDVQVNITDEVMTIRGRRTMKFDVAIDKYFTKECFWGSFARSIILPDSVDSSKVKASFKEGILTVRIPKVERVRNRTVAIH
jgi:HSP20 family protein